ncbi:hypothetical protein P22_0506 [Propionispora sp. 2/2-37]|uniref:flagellar biosynthesis anti-sigma factor FlgM n=1 Tax=Propionispora sp. 2/2-37 TaxID=1677858 RepID=UPI0006BB7884|nr:flagellar biosynthesis anti-sigma factor FlgM [Propionispora sp. 2/2-37]CUH94440.1 hypothetical protein P22_0506 [Propionispora sp. 2/2-37]
MIVSGKQVQNIVKVYGDQNKVGPLNKPEKSGSVQRDEFIPSSNAQEFGQFLYSIKNMPEVREDKVKEFSERIASGKYEVNCSSIAEKMLTGF